MSDYCTVKRVNREYSQMNTFLTWSNLQRGQQPNDPTLKDAFFQSLVYFLSKVACPIEKDDSCEAIQGGQSLLQPILYTIVNTATTRYASDSNHTYSWRCSTLQEVNRHG